MQKDFYKSKLVDAGIEVIVPTLNEQEVVNSIIYDELCQGVVLESSKEKYLSIIQSYQNFGVEAVILGCTEIGMLIQQQHISLPIYDTTEIHVSKIVEFIL